MLAWQMNILLPDHHIIVESKFHLYSDSYGEEFSFEDICAHLFSDLCFKARFYCLIVPKIIILGHD